jgi:hypothetical protein
MRPVSLLAAVLLGPFAAAAVAQEPPPPPVLRLPIGAQVRLRTVAAPGDWLRGTLVGADSEGVGLIPENAPPLSESELRLPRETISRLEIVTGKKRQWLVGLLVGAASGLAISFAVDVDPERCEFDDNYYCSRGEAIAYGTASLGLIGAGVGALVKKDVWTPIALEALGPPPPRVGRVAPRLRVVPGGVSVGLSVGF